MKWLGHIVVGVLAGLSAASAVETGDAVKKPLPVIFDTDMGPDYDDVGALAVLHALADRGEVEPLAMGASNRLKNAVPLIRIINRWYGRGEIPVGSLMGDGPEIDTWHKEKKWTDVLPERYGKAGDDRRENVVDVYRKTLAASADGSVVMISVGFFTNLADLLESPGDGFSPLGGRELVAKKVKRLVSMAGKFPSGKETNIIVDPASAEKVFNEWPVEILISGYEIGRHVRTGDKLIVERKDNPVADAYAMSMEEDRRDKKTSRYEPGGRASYDQTTVLVAVRPDGGYFGAEKGRLTVEKDGTNRWTADVSGNHTTLVKKMPDAGLAEVIEDLMMAMPAGK